MTNQDAGRSVLLNFRRSPAKRVEDSLTPMMESVAHVARGVSSKPA